jgi:hypothetical protein
MFAGVQYLCDYVTDNCNPICLDVCCEASDDMLLVSLFFHRACGLLKNHRTLAALLPHTKRSSAVQVKFHNCNDSVMRVAKRLWVPTMGSKDILLQAKGDHHGQVHSDQMALEMIRRGG